MSLITRTVGGFKALVGHVIHRIGLERSSDGLFIEPANCFVDGGDHVNVGDSTHMYAHKAHTFYVGAAETSLANNGTLDIVLIVGADQAHLSWPPMVEAGGDCTIGLYKTPSYTGATTQKVYNSIDVEDLHDQSTVTAKTGMTVSDTGSLRGGAVNYIPGGAGGRAVGSATSSRVERILNANTSYLLRLTNISGVANRFHLHPQWYDHSPITAKDQV